MYLSLSLFVLDLILLPSIFQKVKFMSSRPDFIVVESLFCFPWPAGYPDSFFFEGLSGFCVWHQIVELARRRYPLFFFFPLVLCPLAPFFASLRFKGNFPLKSPPACCTVISVFSFYPPQSRRPSVWTEISLPSSGPFFFFVGFLYLLPLPRFLLRLFRTLLPTGPRNLTASRFPG